MLTTNEFKFKLRESFLYLHHKFLLFAYFKIYTSDDLVYKNPIFKVQKACFPNEIIELILVLKPIEHNIGTAI